MDPRQKALVQAAMKRRMAQHAPEEDQLAAEEGEEMPNVELAVEDNDDDQRPSLREELNAEPLAGGSDGEVEPDADDELRAQLSDRGQGGALLQRVLEMLSKKKG